MTNRLRTSLLVLMVLSSYLPRAKAVILRTPAGSELSSEADD